MGHKVDFHCFSCRYEELDLGVGAGARPSPYLSLFRCDHCHSVGSAWVAEGQTPRCSFCYDDEPVLLALDTKALDCPKCGKRATLHHRYEDSWQ